MRRIHTYSEMEWDEGLQRYVTVYSEGYDYDGQVVECKGGSKSVNETKTSTAVETRQVGFEDLRDSVAAGRDVTLTDASREYTQVVDARQNTEIDARQNTEIDASRRSDVRDSTVVGGDLVTVDAGAVGALEHTAETSLEAQRGTAGAAISGIEKTAGAAISGVEKTAALLLDESGNILSEIRQGASDAVSVNAGLLKDFAGALADAQQQFSDDLSRSNEAAQGLVETALTRNQETILKGVLTAQQPDAEAQKENVRVLAVAVVLVVGLMAFVRR